MNVLLLDNMDMFLDFALRCTKAGHYVRLCSSKDNKTGKRCTIGDGLVEKIEGEAWQKHTKWADVIVTSDNLKWLPELDRLRKQGYPYFGPSAEAADTEIYRGKGQQLLKKNGVNIIPYQVFSDFMKARKYVIEQGRRFVCKPDGDKDKSLSYVSQSTQDMAFMLRRWKELNPREHNTFIIQEYVKGVEIGVAGWLGKKGFAPYFEENFEFKKLMPDDYGPNTGEMGTAIKYVENSALAKEILLPLESDLMKMGCTGSICVSCMVNEDGSPRPTELTVRLGWPSFNIVQCLHPEPVQWMVDMVDGNNDTFKPSLAHAVGLVVAIPPFPNTKTEDQKKVTGIPIWNLDDDNPYRDYISPAALMAGEAESEDPNVMAKCMVSCGDYLLVASGTGLTVSDAKEKAFAAVKSLEIPNDKEVRIDVGDIEKELKQLQEYGFCKEWIF